jgi:mannose/cellobiose epimerase-like protein (N-acyl-D-glucosamine 2-epimerase family)
VLTGQATDPGSAPVMMLIASMLLAREHRRELSARDRFVAGVAQRAPNRRARSTAA